MDAKCRVFLYVLAQLLVSHLDCAVLSHCVPVIHIPLIREGIQVQPWLKDAKGERHKAKHGLLTGSRMHLGLPPPRHRYLARSPKPFESLLGQVSGEQALRDLCPAKHCGEITPN